MDPGFRSPLIDFFRRGEVARDVRLLAAQGALAPRAQEQLALLILLSDDPDPEVTRAAAATLDALPVEPLRAFLARSDTPEEMRSFFQARGVQPSETPAPMDLEEPLLDTLTEIPDVPEGEGEAERKVLSSLSVLERMKLAMKGTREQRAQLIRDSNKLVSAAVLASPKVNDAEIEAFTKMGNVSEDVLRIIASNRAWMKSYPIVHSLTKNPKTPLGMSLNLMQRLNDRDLAQLSVDRNVPEPLRIAARKKVVAKQSGKERA